MTVYFCELACQIYIPFQYRVAVYKLTILEITLLHQLTKKKRSRQYIGCDMDLPGKENSYFQAEDNFENIDITSKDITVLLVFYVLTAIEVGIF